MPTFPVEFCDEYLYTKQNHILAKHLYKIAKFEKSPFSKGILEWNLAQVGDYEYIYVTEI